MTAFTVELKNQPGELAHLSEAMAARKVNLVLRGTTHGGSGTVAFSATPRRPGHLWPGRVREVTVLSPAVVQVPSAAVRDSHECVPLVGTRSRR